MKHTDAFDLEREIARWRAKLDASGSFIDDDAEELESHLRDEVDSLVGTGLAGDEAFLVAAKRLGTGNEISREYFKVNGNRLWKHLFDGDASRGARTEMLVALGCALAAAALAQIPLLGPRVGGSAGGLLRFPAFFLFPPLAVYVGWKRRLSFRYLGPTFTILAAELLLMSLYPFVQAGDTLLLSSTHLVLLNWILAGVLYTAFESGPGRAYTDYLNFTGELFIYTVLIYLGGGVLVGLSAVVFESIGIELDTAIEHVAVAGGFAAPVLAAYLVEAKRRVLENIAPVLAKIFVPLFTIASTSFLAAMLVTGSSPLVDRELLIALDLLLVVVIAMVFYSISSRNDAEPSRGLDLSNIALLGVSGIVDIVALVAIVFRVASFGLSPNKLAALGENVLLLAHMNAILVAYLRYVLRRGGFDAVERWTTRLIPVYAIWLALVVVLFPPLFRFS